MAKRKKPIVWCRPVICGQQYQVLIGNKDNCPDLSHDPVTGATDEACTAWETSTISVREDLGDGRKEDCLIHEVLVHAVIEASGMGRILADKHKLSSEQWEALEEDLALLWSPAVLATLKANGWLKLPKVPKRRAPAVPASAPKLKKSTYRKAVKK